MTASLAAFAFAATAHAILVVDQQSAYDTSMPAITVGGTNNVIVAQTVTAGSTAELMEIEVGIACDGGTLVLEIRNLAPGRVVPGTVVRTSVSTEAALLPAPPEPRRFRLDRALSMPAGHPYAIVLRNEGGTCQVIRSTKGDPYPGGQGWFRQASGSPDAWLQFLDFGDTNDLGFRTFVNVVPDSPPCTVNGSPTPFPGWLPVCRCIEDEGLRDQRCALFHPDFVFLRNAPFLKPGEPFTIRWTLVALAPLKGVIELDESLPDGFRSSLKGPLTFFADQLAPGKSITLEYTAVAGVKGGKVETIVRRSGEDARMQSVIEVRK